MLTQLGEKMADEGADELLKGVQVGRYVVTFVSWVCAEIAIAVMAMSRIICSHNL